MNLLLLTITLIKIIEINCHGRLVDPASRSTAWRFDSRFPVYYDDTAMYCGGFGVQQQNGGKCGICGEDYAQAKQFEKGGKLYKGYIIKSYQQGQVITVNVEITANHIGYFEFMLCNVDGWQSDATQQCLEKTYLKDSTTGQTKIYIQRQTGYIYAKLKLPDTLTCNHCVLQWRYNTGNSWGTDPLTGQSGLGYGPQEQFYGCSDISIKLRNGQVDSTVSVAATTTRPQNIVSSTTTRNNQIISTTATSKPNGNGKCLNGDGLYANPGCKTFYQCSFSGTASQQVHNFDCPNGLLFDNSAKVCNWPSLVNCKN